MFNYGIVLTDGKIINIKADSVEWFEKSQTIRFLYKREVVARINMSNIVGYVDLRNIDYKESEE